MLKHANTICYFFSELIFGFVPSAISVNESEGLVVFNVQLISGILSREIVIEFFSEDGSAEGK